MSLWHSQSEELQSGQVIRYRIAKSTGYLCTAEVIELWQDNLNFRAFYSSTLADCPFSAFRWETPPCMSENTDQEFEYVLINSPSLSRLPNQSAFRGYFDWAESGEEVISFPNLRQDADLIVPCPIAIDSIYVHLASFVRQAPESQQQSLWQCVGEKMAAQLRRSPLAIIWLNTAGMGVPWLHIRLDSRPKYYTFTPYKDWPRSW